MKRQKRTDPAMLSYLAPPTRASEDRSCGWIFWVVALLFIVGAVFLLQMEIYGDAPPSDPWMILAWQTLVAGLSAAVAIWIYPTVARKFMTVRLSEGEARWRDCYICMDCKCAFLRHQRPVVMLDKIRELLWTRR
jgi:hypothetical protein